MFMWISASRSVRALEKRKKNIYLIYNKIMAKPKAGKRKKKTWGLVVKGGVDKWKKPCKGLDQNHILIMYRKIERGKGRKGVQENPTQE